MLALGLVETRGLLAAIEGADAMLKAADVRLLEKNLATGGLVTITIAGEVSAVQASVDAAKACILRIAGAELVSAHVIPRPDQELNGILLLDPDPNDPRDAKYFPSGEELSPDAASGAPEAASSEPLTETSGKSGGPAAEEAPAASLSETAETAAALPDAERQTSALPEPARLKNMNLNRLRQLARTMDGLSMTEEAIASADKKSLITAITRALRKIEE